MTEYQRERVRLCVDQLSIAMQVATPLWQTQQRRLPYDTRIFP